MIRTLSLFYWSNNPMSFDLEEELIILEAKLDLAIEALKKINQEELNSQRPGGGYTTSARISYQALQELEK